MNTTPTFDTRAAHARLLNRFLELPSDTPPEFRWTWLEALHVIGEPVLALHWDSHRRMLALAWETCDLPEAIGQMLRLALVPLGHALRRLPSGNIGRSTVSAFRAMQPPPAVRALIERVGDPGPDLLRR